MNELTAQPLQLIISPLPAGRDITHPNESREAHMAATVRTAESITIRANLAYNRAAARRGVFAHVRALVMAEALTRCVVATESRPA